jgi:hypothetical protein
MGKRRDRLDEVRFHCAACESKFDSEPHRVEDAEHDTWHPWVYFAPCPFCGTEATQCRQQRHLLKMWASATGPKTAEGRAKVAKNLEGHPTPEVAQRTRFNALKHGLSARVATFWPARPGRYAQCTECEFLGNGCTTEKACQKKTELFLRHHVAFETGDTSLLAELRGDLHANLTAIINDLLLSVIAEGATRKTPEWYYDREGCFHLARYFDPQTQDEVQIMKLEVHPAIKLVGELVTRLGLDLSSQGMTPKVQDDADVVRGNLADDGKERGGLLEYQQKQAKALEDLRGMLDRSREKTRRDPVLLEHMSGEAEDA